MKRHLTCLCKKIANKRRGWCFKLALRLVRKYDTIAIENLSIEGIKHLWVRKVSDLAFREFVKILQFLRRSETFIFQNISRRYSVPVNTVSKKEQDVTLAL